MNFRDVLSRLTDERLDVGRSFLGVLEIAIGHFERANGRVDLTALDAAHVRVMMRLLMPDHATPTVNNNRRYVFYLWQTARNFGWGAPPVPRLDVRKLKEVWRKPTAWRAEELARLMTACRKAPTRRGWGPTHWESLTLTVYDTSLRIGALMKSTISQIDHQRCALLVPGELQKGLADTYQSIHEDTCIKLMSLPRPAGDKRLFPWPFAKDEIWRQFTSRVLIPAGLPHTRRDKFHRIRRTSYTLVAKEHGIAAASQHAAHKSDLSKYYLDPTFLDRPNPLDALPRPPEERAG